VLLVVRRQTRRPAQPGSSSPTWQGKPGRPTASTNLWREWHGVEVDAPTGACRTPWPGALHSAERGALLLCGLNAYSKANPLRICPNPARAVARYRHRALPQLAGPAPPPEPDPPAGPRWRAAADADGGPGAAAEAASRTAGARLRASASGHPDKTLVFHVTAQTGFNFPARIRQHPPGRAPPPGPPPSPISTSRPLEPTWAPARSSPNLQPAATPGVNNTVISGRNGSGKSAPDQAAVPQIYPVGSSRDSWWPLRHQTRISGSAGPVGLVSQDLQANYRGARAGPRCGALPAFVARWGIGPSQQPTVRPQAGW